MAIDGWAAAVAVGSVEGVSNTSDPKIGQHERLIETSDGPDVLHISFGSEKGTDVDAIAKVAAERKVAGSAEVVHGDKGVLSELVDENNETVGYKVEHSKGSGKIVSTYDRNGSYESSYFQAGSVDSPSEKIPFSTELEAKIRSVIGEQFGDAAAKIHPGGMGIDADQYALHRNSIQGQLQSTNLRLSASQKTTLSQQLAQLGLNDVELHQMPDGSISIANKEGSAVGHLEQQSDGSIRYVDDHDNGFEVSPNGRSQMVFKGYSESDRQQAQQLQSGLGAVQSALSLIQALEQGNTFSAALAGVSMMNQMIAASGGNLPPELASMVGPMRDIGAGLGAVSAAMNLAEAIKQGDAMGILQSSANLGSQGIHLYAAMEGLELVDKAGKATGALGSAAQGLGAVAAGVGLVMAIESGNPVSMATSALSLMSSIGMINPYIGVAIAIYSLVSSLFSNSDQPMLEGQAQAIWDESGTTQVITTQNSHNGGATATNWMNNLVSGLQAQLAGVVDAHGQPVYQRTRSQQDRLSHRHTHQHRCAQCPATIGQCTA